MVRTSVCGLPQLKHWKPRFDSSLRQALFFFAFFAFCWRSWRPLDVGVRMVMVAAFLTLCRVARLQDDCCFVDLGPLARHLVSLLIMESNWRLPVLFSSSGLALPAPWCIDLCGWRSWHVSVPCKEEQILTSTASQLSVRPVHEFEPHRQDIFLPSTKQSDNEPFMPCLHFLVPDDNTQGRSPATRIRRPTRD